jgi:hypothetical protein
MAGKTLCDYGIQHKWTLELESMQIHVLTPAGKKVALTGYPNDKVKDIKSTSGRKGRHSGQRTAIGVLGQTSEGWQQAIGLWNPTWRFRGHGWHADVWQG